MRATGKMENSWFCDQPRRMAKCTGRKRWGFRMSDWDMVMASVAASYREAGRPQRVLAAVSGGADSLAMLELLAALQKAESFCLAVCHVNHGLRSQAVQDAALTEDRCRALDVPCRICNVQVDAPGENGARNARYAALFAVAMEWNADAIALAHHQDDQAETLLLHLLRGSGGAGLAAMRPCVWREMGDGRAVLLWRPLLDVPPSALRAILTERCIVWAEDETNSDSKYLRNFLRLDILPKIQEKMPDVKRALCRSADILGAEDELLAEQAKSFLSANGSALPPCRYVLRASFAALHPALQRRVIRALCPVPLEFSDTERVRLSGTGDTVNLPGCWHAEITEKRLHLLPPVSENVPPGKLTVAPYQGNTGDGILCQVVPKAVFEKSALRFRQPGDRIRPLGGPGEKSLQDYLTDRKVDRPFRDYVPLLCMDEQVVWVIGIGPGEEVRVSTGTEAVLLRYEGTLPGGGSIRDDVKTHQKRTGER